MAGSFLNKLPFFTISSAGVVEDIDNFNCPICLEIFTKPRKISCGHVFCKDCLKNYEGILEPACPVCRQLFVLADSKKDSDLLKAIHSSAWVCRECSEKVPLSKLKHHNNVSCPAQKESLVEASVTCEGATGISKRSSPAKSAVPNRHTFQCPYCGVRNLDTHDLVKHCNDFHNDHPGQVVCPICASMPWGNPKQKSTNFFQHLNLRHQFEYGFVVDFSLSDDDAFKKALKASMEEQ